MVDGDSPTSKTPAHRIVISDHADWPGLLEAIKASQAHTIHLVHGNGNWLAQLLLKEGKQVVCHQTSSQKVA